MALKAMKVAKRHSAVKNVHKAKSDVIKAKAHKVKQKPSQAQAKEMDFVIQEGHEKEQEEKQYDEQEGDCHEDETTEKRPRQTSLERNTTTLGSHCPRHRWLCKKQGLGNKNIWPEPMLIRRALSHCKGKTL